PRPLPALIAAHTASSLSADSEVARWRAAAVAHAAHEYPTPVRTIRLPEPMPRDEAVHEFIAGRGSARRFASQPIAAQVMGAIGRAAAATPHGDAWPYDRPLCEPLLAVRTVDGL